MRSKDAVQVVLSFDDPEDDVDITGHVLTGSVRRGRPPGGPTRAGTCNITLKNESRLFDPPWAGGTPGAFGWVRPGQRVQVFWNSIPIFEGHVDDWFPSYPVGKPATASFTASDALARLAQRSLDEWLTTAGQYIGERLTEMFARTEIDWSGTTDFDHGAIKLQDDFNPAGTNALGYVQLLERTDGGRFFASAANVLTYRGVNRSTSASTVLTFSDDNTGIHGMNDTDVSFDSEEWYTQVNITRLDGDIQTASSDPSITALHGGGFRPLDLEDLLMATDAAALNLAQYKLGIYENFEPFVSGLTCVLDALSDSDGDAVAGLEIGDQVGTNWTPTGAGNAADQTLAVETLADDWTPHLFTRKVGLSRLIGVQSWVIGTSQIGTGVLGV